MCVHLATCRSAFTHTHTARANERNKAKKRNVLQMVNVRYSSSSFFPLVVLVFLLLLLVRSIRLFIPRAPTRLPFIYSAQKIVSLCVCVAPFRITLRPERMGGGWHTVGSRIHASFAHIHASYTYYATTIVWWLFILYLLSLKPVAHTHFRLEWRRSAHTHTYIFGPSFIIPFNSLESNRH